MEDSMDGIRENIHSGILESTASICYDEVQYKGYAAKAYLQNRSTRGENVKRHDI